MVLLMRGNKDIIACARCQPETVGQSQFITLFLERYMNVCVDLTQYQYPILRRSPSWFIDCWEHSYYRDYLNDRKTYVFAMMKELEWEVIEKRVKKS